MTIEIFLSICFLAGAAIAYAITRLTETDRVKYVNQKVVW